MANPVVNVPPADLLKSFIQRILRQSAVNHPALVGLTPSLRDAVTALDANIGLNEQNTDYAKARAAAGVKDGVHDRWHGFMVELFEAFARHPDEGLSAAASYLLTVLYPDGLGAVTQAAWEVEAAAGVTYERRLQQPRAKAAVATLVPEVPKLESYLASTVAAAADLGAALEVLDGFLVDKAGRPMNPKLFAARTEAHKRLAAFANAVETFAYPSDSEEDRKARAALLGPYRRFLAAVPRAGGAERADAVAESPPGVSDASSGDAGATQPT